MKMIRILSALSLLTTMIVVATGSDDAAQALGPVQISYVVSPHPDDEWSTWSLVDNSSDNYKVFIYMTRGEETGACRKINEASAGPYWYQGPASPVGQPNYGEIDPANSQWSNASGGRFSTNCTNARRAANRNFLNDRAAADPSLPGAFTSSTTGCFTGNTSAGLPPRREDNGVVTNQFCYVMYNAPNGLGKLIYLNLGDGDLLKEEVEWALLRVRNNKAALGIPNLPDVNAIGAFRNLLNPSCMVYDHPDHRAVHDALWIYDMNIGKQYGRTCSTDPDSAPPSGRTNTIPAAAQYWAFQMSGNTRVGLFERRYGWLTGSYWSDPVNSYVLPDYIFAPTQAFWSRFTYP
jgi:hypothetical protein